MGRYRRCVVVAGLSALLPVLQPPAAAIGVGPASPVPLSDCVSSDHGDPVVTSVAVAPATVDTTAAAATVGVTVTATDTGGPGPATGVRQVVVGLQGPPGGASPVAEVVMTSDGAGTWRAALILPRGAAPGVYRTQLTVRDAAGSVVLWGAHTGQPLDASLTVVSTEDVAAPRLVSLRLGRHAVDTRARVQRFDVTARVRDDLAGVSGLVVTAGRGRRSVDVALVRVSGTELDGRWRGTLTVPRWTGDTTWLMAATVLDGVGRSRAYGSRSLRALGDRADRAVRVTGRRDEARPTARGLTLEPATVDVHEQDGQLRLRVRARDARSGVAAVRVELVDPRASEAGPTTSLHRVSGTRHDGTWEATVTVPRCASSADGGAWLVRLQVRDLAGWVRRYDFLRPTVQVVGADHAPPRAVRTSGPGGAPVLDFDEDVTGITGTSAVVVRQDSEAVVAGTWACTGVTGDVADCATGAVRRAAFLPQAGPPRTGGLSVVLNPEHSLGVTDLAGNPATRSWTL